VRATTTAPVAPLSLVDAILAGEVVLVHGRACDPLEGIVSDKTPEERAAEQARRSTAEQIEAGVHQPNYSNADRLRRTGLADRRGQPIPSKHARRVGVKDRRRP
jgi:hypothetical protein